MELIKRITNDHISAIVLPAFVGIVGAFAIGLVFNISHAQEHDDFTYDKASRGAISNLCRLQPANLVCIPHGHKRAK